MGDVDINFKVMYDTIAQSPEIQRSIDGIFNQRFNLLKEELIVDFEEDPISEEITAGPFAQTSILPNNYGNLFSFIGFQQGENPIKDIVKILREQIKYQRLSYQTTRSGIKYKYSVSLPYETLFINTPFPNEWAPGRSWLFAIEQGIKGFQYYIFPRYSSKSRSGAAFQIKNPVKKRAGQKYLNRKYMSEYLNQFAHKLGGVV